MNDMACDVFSRLDEVCGPDEDFRRELTLSFIETGDKDILRLRDAAAAANVAELVALVHLVRGACATMGACALAERCGVVEKALREGCSCESVERPVADIQVAWIALREDLSSALG